MKTSLLYSLDFAKNHAYFTTQKTCSLRQWYLTKSIVAVNNQSFWKFSGFSTERAYRPKQRHGDLYRSITHYQHRQIKADKYIPPNSTTRQNLEHFSQAVARLKKHARWICNVIKLHDHAMNIGKILKAHLIVAIWYLVVNANSNNNF